MNTTTEPLTRDDLLAGYRNDDFGGFGYLGGRTAALDTSDAETAVAPALVARVDDLVVAHANRAGWTAADLFAWANSKYGRWFADAMLWAGAPSIVPPKVGRLLTRVG